MVRLEKIFTEKLFNHKIFGRDRRITKPSRIELLEEFCLRMTPWGQYLVKLIPARWLVVLGSLQYKFYRWNIISRGFSWEDTAIYSDEMLRHSAIFSHIYRENMNPYQYNLIAFRRRRYYKVDYAVEGFYAQEEVQREAAQQTFLEVRPEILKFQRLFHEYQNEMIPQTHYTNGSLGSIFDLLFFRNVFLRVGWNRYFFNEEHYVNPNELREDLAATTQSLGDAEARDYMRFYNKHYPGIIAPDGEEVDFGRMQQFVAAHPDMIDKDGGFDLLGFLDIFFRQREPAQVDTTPRKEVVEHPNMVGLDLPEVLSEKRGTPLM